VYVVFKHKMLLTYQFCIFGFLSCIFLFGGHTSADC